MAYRVKAVGGDTAEELIRCPYDSTLIPSADVSSLAARFVRRADSEKKTLTRFVFQFSSANLFDVDEDGRRLTEHVIRCTLHVVT